MKADGTTAGTVGQEGGDRGKTIRGCARECCENPVVGRGGIEPPTPGFSVPCQTRDYRKPFDGIGLNPRNHRLLTCPPQWLLARWFLSQLDSFSTELTHYPQERYSPAPTSTRLQFGESSGVRRGFLIHFPSATPRYLILFYESVSKLCQDRRVQ